jgi:hypothetical protein
VGRRVDEEPEGIVVRTRGEEEVPRASWTGERQCLAEEIDHPGDVWGNSRHVHTVARADGGLHRWWNDDAFDEHKSHIVHYQPHGIIPLNEFEQAFAGFRNLSTKRARAVSRHFKNSIALASSASAKEWAAIETADEAGKVRKIGDKTATDIVRFLHGEKRA